MSLTPSSHHPVLVDIQTQALVSNLFVLGWYNWPLDTLIHLIKFKQRPAFCHLISQWFIKYTLNENFFNRKTSDKNALHRNTLPEALIAMPSGKWKQFIRGYNPPTILTGLLCSNLKLKDCSSYLQINSSWVNQHHLSRINRLSRTQSFTCFKLPSHIKHIAIFDDVITTGSTMLGAVKAVKQANPKIKISAWCVAATQP